MAHLKEIMTLLLNSRSFSYVAAALGCSNRNISEVQAVIDDHNITPENFSRLPLAVFDEMFTDQRRRGSISWDQPDFKALASKLSKDKHLTSIGRITALPG